ncbi:OmpA family protein [Psychrobacter aestuarii]|uniref:OmpA-like domain-containing protein n=1 Tax=Psychrobacter aestuarii TaxID=556327 RepID=A0ABN0W062_9GAMM|nr:OmpA family protein [Psychrobacter aestuarii]
MLKTLPLSIVITAALTGCQTLTPSTPFSTEHNKKLIKNQVSMTANTEVMDSDGDGVLDDVDKCPKTPLHRVVDRQGCIIIIEGGTALEMSFVGFFASMSSELPNSYAREFAQIEKSLNDHPKASVFIFGHSATKEHDAATMPRAIGDALARDRARMLKNKLVFTHGIAPERIRTYDCADRYLVTDNAFTDAHFKVLGINTIEEKQRRVILMASDEVHDLQNFKYKSAEQLYGEYARQCDVFK